MIEFYCFAVFVVCMSMVVVFWLEAFSKSEKVRDLAKDCYLYGGVCLACITALAFFSG